jgi:NTP pyrophosphatase (non-canonical NTP hydrolase)
MSQSLTSELPGWLLRQRAYNDVAVERIRQIEKWGDQRHDDAWWCVIEMEELGEVARAVYERDTQTTRKRDTDQLRDELVQVAAVAVAWIEDIDSRDGTGWKNEGQWGPGDPGEIPHG